MRIFSVIVFIVLCCLSNAQRPLGYKEKTDSLTRKFQQNVDDSIKARITFELARLYIDTDSAIAFRYMEIGRNIGKKYPYIQALYYFYFAQLIDISGHSFKAEAVYMKADSLLARYKTNEAHRVVSMIWYSYSAIQHKRGRQQRAVDIILNKAIPFARLASDHTSVGVYYGGVGLHFLNIGQYKIADGYFIQSQKSLKQGGASDTEMAYLYLNWCLNYLYSKEYNRAKVCLDSAYILLEPYPESELFTEYYQDKASYYTETKQYATAMGAINQGIILTKKLNDEYGEEDFLFKKIKLYKLQGEHNKAVQIVFTILNNPTIAVAENRAYLYSSLAESYANLNNMKAAYLWQKKYSDLRDSLNDANIEQNINELELKFKTAEKEKKIAVLEAEKKEAILKQRNSRLTNWLLGVGCLLFLTIGIAFYSFYKKNKKIAEQQLQEIKSQQEIRLSQALLEGEDRERQRLARDLHDGLGGMLAGVKINLSRQSKMENQNLDVAINQLDQSVSELRRIARNMMPESLVRFGLQTSLSDLCDSFNSTNTQVKFEAIDIKKDMELSVQIVIYRIIQEALSNAIRHADAKNILLQCSQNEDTFFITIEDDGKGFDMSELQNKKGIGLSNIENRVKYLKGKLDIASQPNEGTTINVEVSVAA